MKMMQFRKIMAVILMVLGAAMLARGVVFALSSGLGLQGMIQALVVGALVFALGFTRWRYLSQR
jgi:hypothetical protein